MTLIGNGKWNDHIRPMFAPPSNSETPPKLNFTYLLPDDKQTALVEYISRDKASLKAIRQAANAPGVKDFEPKKNSKADIEIEF